MAAHKRTSRKRQAPIEMGQRLAYRPREVAALVGRSEGTIYADIATGVLYAVRRGHRFLVPIDAVRAYVNGQVYRPQ